MADLVKWGAEYEAVKSAFYRIRMRGVYLTEDEQRRFMSECMGIATSLKQIVATGGGIPASEIARREVLISNLEGQVRKARITSKQSNTDNTNFNPMELSYHGLALHHNATINMQNEIIEQIGR